MNPKLVMWDYGKEINVTLEDALISLESLRLMMGGQILKSGAESKVTVHLTEEGVVATADTAPSVFDHLTGAEYKMGEITEYRYINLTTGVRGQVSAEGEGNTFKAAAGDRVRFFWTKETVQEDQAVEITISPNTFPGTYKIVGDTFMRSEQTGADEAFQFVINKAKVLSEVTITLEARKSFGLFKSRELLEAA